MIYEHYHRYLWARELVAGRRVLDLGSGEGFGAGMLAERAATVTGVDIDERTVDHARLNYEAPNVKFRVGSAADLSDFAEDAFDAVVAFEVIEHLEEQEQMLAEIARVLAPGGLLICSTPDRRAYSEATGQENPFHERELTREEFEALLGGQFENRLLFGQRVMTGSRIDPLGSPHGSHLTLQIERRGEDWQPASPPSPLYLIAVAGDGPLPELASSSLADFDLALMREQERHAVLARAEAEQAERERDAERRQLAAERENREEERRHHVEAEDKLAQEILAQAREVAARDGELAGLRAEAASARSELARIESSVSFRVLNSLRARFHARVGERSLVASALSALLRGLGRLAFDRGGDAEEAPDPRTFAPIALPEFDEPVASIVIPVHSGADLTERCLHSILATSGVTTYEVIIVDDDADADTKSLLSAVRGARVVVNEENLGFLHSTNRGAAEARGRYLVLLNNDTEPQVGWLDALAERAASAPDVGAVAAKLVYADSTLQEAGGIVWQDGSAWNYGRGDDPWAPEHNFVREIDYGSAAALLVRAELWRTIGGFDERFAPGYWEDTDLCFAVRARGHRVLYEPHALVVHHEGSSMGTDPSIGGKRHERLNAPKFRDKWRDALLEQLPQRSAARAKLASDRRRGPRVLVADHRVPTPDRDSGSLRMWHLLRNLVDLGCRVTFVPDDFDPMQPYTRRLQSMGIEVLYGDVDMIVRIADLGPRLQLAILSRPYVAPRYLHIVREHAPNARVAFDTVDLHFLREQRRAAGEAGRGSGVADSFRELELGVARGSDVTIVVSEEEREQLAAVAPDIEAEVVPNANELSPDVPGPEGRDGLLFVGGFEHIPNVDAAVYLARTVMPRVWRRVPDVALTIVGADPPAEVRALDSPGVKVAGWVEDLEPLLRESRAVVAPLRYGAGMKGKVTQSLAAGLPVVTTTIGAEGLNAVDGEHLLVADDANGFADRVADICTNDELWRSLSASGQHLVERVCSPRVQRQALRRLLSAEEPAELAAERGR